MGVKWVLKNGHDLVGMDERVNHLFGNLSYTGTLRFHTVMQ